MVEVVDMKMVTVVVKVMMAGSDDGALVSGDITGDGWW